MKIIVLLLSLSSTFVFAMCEDANRPFRPGDLSEEAQLYNAIQACASQSNGQCGCTTIEDRRCVRAAAQQVVDHVNFQNNVTGLGVGAGSAAAGYVAFEVGTGVLGEAVYLSAAAEAALTAAASLAVVAAAAGFYIGEQYLQSQNANSLEQFMNLPQFQFCEVCDPRTDPNRCATTTDWPGADAP